MKSSQNDEVLLFSLSRSLLISSIRMGKKELRQAEEKISRVQMRQRLRQWSPYGAMVTTVLPYPIWLAATLEGRLASTVSVLVQHSSADLAGAEAEREDRAIGLGKGVECLVEGAFYEVEVAEDGDGRRTWREVFGSL